jgi:DNA-binding transcriptional LysR family regulator
LPLEFGVNGSIATNSFPFGGDPDILPAIASTRERNLERFESERMLIAVLDTGSFAAAARRLGVSSGQASKLVAKLETDLGAQLIKRTTRSLSATEAGRAYYEQLKPLLDEFDALATSVGRASAIPAGRLRLTAPQSFGVSQLASVLVEFARKYPEIALDVSFSDRVANLVDEGFDAALRIGAPEDSSLIARRLCPMRVVVAASPAYLAEHGAPRTPDDLDQHPCIIDSNFQDPLQWRFRDASGVGFVKSVTGRLHFANAEACATACKAGLGVARTPSFIGGPQFRAGKLVPLLGDWEEEPYGVHVLYPRARHLALKVRALVDFLVAQFQGEPVWDRGWPR